MTTMKKQFTILILLICRIFSGQNLVPNYSFENITSCPTYQNNIYKASPWFQPCVFFGNTTNSSSSDLFNTCGTSGWQCPVNALGVQNARTGNGYGGLNPYNDGEDVTEYIEVPLISPLIANKRYCLEFYVSLADSSHWSISNIGAYFSVDSILDSAYYLTLTHLTPQVENSVSNMLNDNTNWTLVSGYFIANGGEKFMTIGNFNHWWLTNRQNNISTGLGTAYYQTAYYYIDDVSLFDCTGLLVDELNKDNETIDIYPNLITNELTVNINNNEPVEIILYDLSSRKLLQEIFTKTKIINTEQLTKGLYLYTVSNKNGIIKNGKIIKE